MAKLPKTLIIAQGCTPSTSKIETVVWSLLPIRSKKKYIPDLDITKISIGQKLRINELNFEADAIPSLKPIRWLLINRILRKNQSVTIEIGGHTNTIPPHEYCDKLSTDRAKNVAEHLYDRGIATNRITYKGYGKREPLTDSTSAQGRQRNQRVEIKILAI